MRTRLKAILNAVLIMVLLLIGQSSFSQNNSTTVPDCQDTLLPIRYDLEIVKQEQNLLSCRVDDLRSLLENSTALISNDFASGNRAC